MKLYFLLFLLMPFFFFGQTPLTKEMRYKQTIQDIGDVAQFAPAAVSLATIIIFKDKKGGWQFLKSFSTNILTTYALKYAINKPRPEGRTDGHAFPSGHTSLAFQGASFLQRRYGWSYGIPAYVVAGFVAYSRLDGIHKRHDGWDVIGGIIVGVGSTYLFTTPYQKEHLNLSFSGNNGDYLIGINYKF